MSWSPQMRESRRSRGGQADMFDSLVLNYELFAGDETDTVLLANKMLLTRKPHDCVICAETIPAGTRVRAQSEVNREDNQVGRFYVCVPCCEAIAKRFDDDGHAIDARIAARRAA
ncbi:hypothetical protein LB566_23365 [Mesorhizobium sp. CA13]|uniref:hypothetical protein n=1 Tax=Mesorhizobium sp. CA13 TaxID=2876643 RepID=UPI001CCE1027|nr:hypothetical protein [Mesorhizobium sp. CA13]MBZ9856735.1 hypothetical protein [Mesorhizobium sp. CA13]